MGRLRSGQSHQTVNLAAYAFGGSNPPLPTAVSLISIGRATEEAKFAMMPRIRREPVYELR